MKFNKSLLEEYKTNILVQNSIIESITIYKNTSRPRAKKECIYYLHVLEPTGIEVTKNTIVKISFKEKNINGAIDLYLHNTDNIKRLTRIDVAIGKSVTIPEAGELFFQINAVKSSTLEIDEKFDFTIYLEFNDSSSYLINPIFDIRQNKISKHNILDHEIFKQQVLNDENKEHGMVMISDNSRVYMPKSKYIPQDFNPIQTLNLYEDIITSYNKLAGFNKDDLNFLFRPREQFVLISAVNSPQTLSTMLTTLPQTSYLYFNDYWDIFFQFAELFEQNWSLLEIWTNMYAIYMGNNTVGIDWLWETTREDFENKNIEPLYDKYLIKNMQGQINLDVKQEVYMLFSMLESLGADFITKLEKYSRENKAYLYGIEYILYYVAKIFGVNAIPYSEIYGQRMLDKSLVSNIVDMSNTSLLYVPFNSTFNKYKDISSPVTTKLVYIDDPVVVGLANPYARITIKIGDKKDIALADFTGQFRYRMLYPIAINDSITITSREPHKNESIPKTTNIVTRLANNSINFIGLNGYAIAKLMFDTVKKELIVVSTGKKFNISGTSDIYFTLILKDKTGRIKAQAIIKENEDAKSFEDALNEKSFEYLDNITLSYKNEGFIFVSKYEGKIIYNPKGQSERFNITTCGLLEYFE